MLTLKNKWLEVGVDEADGCIHTLRLAAPSDPASTEYVEPTSLSDGTAACLWGQWEVRDSFTAYKPSEGTVRVTGSPTAITSTWELAGFTLTIVRELQAAYLSETVSLTAKRTMAVIDLSVAFRPAVTDFLDATNVSVGEHASYVLTDERRTAYHWFTGGDYAHLMFTQVTGRGPHLGVVLAEGRIHALTTPYLHGGPSLTNDHQAFTTHQMYPRLHVTCFATHKQSDEYPQPILDMRRGDTETFTLRYFPFESIDEFSRNVRDLCQQPTFDYPRFWPAGREMTIVVDSPGEGIVPSATHEGAALPVKHLTATTYRFALRPERSGLHRIDIAYGDRTTFILMEAVHDVGELLRQRVDYILSAQQCLDPADARYAGIFMTDMQTGEWLTSDHLYTVQTGGSGEMVATGQLVAYQNLIDPDPAQIARAETYANRWIRERCQDEDFSTPLNPLNRMRFKDRGWKYESGLERIFHNPEFHPEKAWRVHNANWIAPFYYLMSEIPDRWLTVQTSATYLDWAYRTMRWQLATELRMSADQSYFVPQVIEKLTATGRADAAADLGSLWHGFVDRVVDSARRLGNRSFTFDDSMFYCSAIPLLIESKVDEAKVFLESYPYNIGVSYDPRVQTAFRYWDDYLTSLPYLMMPYLTRPHFWSITDCYPLLQLYEATHDERALDSAYQGIMAFYEHYNFGYRWNRWGEMTIGQGHPCFLPSHDLHTQERVCADQDPAFVTYLETFGRRCYITPTGRAVNASTTGTRVESWAPFPTDYHLDDRGLAVSSSPRSVTLPWVETGTGLVRVLVRNLGGDAVEAVVTIRGAADQRVTVALAAQADQVVELSV
jgi:hypothetical protein